ncbi:MAG: hypothetical protein NBV77_08570 [Bacteroidia bacterium]|nr:hypothetical protein [Bacteroidia bacterium]
MIRLLFNFTLISCVALWNLGCKDEKLNNKYTYFSEQCTQLDSIQSFIRLNESRLPDNVSFIVSSNLRQKGLHSKADSFTDWYKQFSDNSNISESKITYLNLASSYMYLRKGNLELAKKTIDAVSISEGLKDFSDTMVVLNYYNLKGMLHYFYGDFISAISWYDLGYKWAFRFDKVKELEQFSNNKGAIYYSMGRKETAIENFIISYDLLRRRQGRNPILNNNIASILMSQYKLKEAEKYLKECDKELVPSNLEYNGVLIKLNFCRLLIMKKEYKLANSFMLSLNKSIIPKVLLADYFMNQIILGLQESNNIKAFIQANKHELNECRFEFLGKFNIGFNPIIREIPGFAKLVGFSSADLDSLNDISVSHYTKSVLLEILANQAERDNDINAFKRNIKMSVDVLKLESKTLDSIRVLDFESRIQHQKLQREFQIMKSEQKKTSRIIVWQKIVIGISLIMVVLSVSVYIYRSKFIQQRQEFFRSQLESANQLATKLKNENHLNAKIAALSSMLIEQSQNIHRKLSESKFAKDPIILQVKLDLDRISKSQNINLQDTSRVDVSYRYDIIWKNQNFSELSKTQRDILILSIEGVKPIEIAKYLNLSYSHVRNMRSKFKKMMIDLGISDFEDLLKL